MNGDMMLYKIASRVREKFFRSGIIVTLQTLACFPEIYRGEKVNKESSKTVIKT
jgi:hypothetical protein